MSLLNSYTEENEVIEELTEIEKKDLEIGMKRSKVFKSIEDRKMQAALRAELGDDELTSAELHEIFK